MAGTCLIVQYNQDDKVSTAGKAINETINPKGARSRLISLATQFAEPHEVKFLMARTEGHSYYTFGKSPSDYCKLPASVRAALKP